MHSAVYVHSTEQIYLGEPFHFRIIALDERAHSVHSRGVDYDVEAYALCLQLAGDRGDSITVGHVCGIAYRALNLALGDINAEHCMTALCESLCYCASDAGCDTGYQNRLFICFHPPPPRFLYILSQRLEKCKF